MEVFMSNNNRCQNKRVFVLAKLVISSVLIVLVVFSILQYKKENMHPSNSNETVDTSDTNADTQKTGSVTDIEIDEFNTETTDKASQEMSEENLANQGQDEPPHLDIKNSEESLDKAYEQAITLTDHLIHHVMTKQWLNADYSYSDADIWRFVISLCLYEDTIAHPYNCMLIVNEDDYQITFDNAIQIANELFSCENWSPINYSWDEGINQCYSIANGVGLWNRIFTYEIVSMATYGDNLCVDFELISGSLFGEEELIHYGCYSLVYQFVTTDSGDYLRLFEFKQASRQN